MTISRKTMLVSTAVLVATVVFLGIFYWAASENTRRKETEIIARFRESNEELANLQIRSLGENIANYLVQIEDQLDLAMRNAALLLQARAESRDPEESELREMLELTGMSDLYLAGTDGRFYRSTEKASLGVSIFDIWDGYRMIIEGKATELPSPIKSKVETGEIFKFTAIPKIDAEGRITGIIEAALNASTSIERIMQGQLQQNTQLDSIYIIEHSGLVLTGNVREGKKPLFTVGTTITDREILSVASDNRAFLKWSADDSSVVYCLPVQRFGGPAYVLHITVDPLLYVRNAQAIQSQFKELETAYASSTLQIVTFFLAMLLLVIILYAFFIRRSLLRPIKRLSGILDNISEGEGDLTEKLPVQGNDEIGSMAEKFNTFAERIKEIIIEAQRAGSSIGDGTTEILKNLESAYSRIREISEQVEHVSGNVALQAENAANCEQLSHELSGNIGSLSSQINETFQLLGRVVASKDDGENKIAGLVEKNARGVESNRSTADNIRRLRDQISDINRIVDEIKAIAKQTQLLALNASIEAARAGEHGLGFAVVAGEVNDLAVQSARSALEIEKITSALGQSSSESVESVSGVVELAEEQNKLVGEARGAFESIGREIREMESTLENVRSVLETVESSKESMADNIRDLSGKSLENEASVHAMESSVESQVQLMKNIHALSEDTEATADNLSRALGRFKTEK